MHEAETEPPSNNSMVAFFSFSYHGVKAGFVVSSQNLTYALVGDMSEALNSLYLEKMNDRDRVFSDKKGSRHCGIFVL